MKPLLIGEAPRAGYPKTGTSSSRVALLLGVDPGSLLDFIAWRNLFTEPQEGSGKGDAFPMERARERASKFRMRTDTVVFLGRRVAAAFGVKSKYFEWTKVRGKRAAVFPHPSGINRWWNDADNVDEARRFIRGICHVGGR